jgi:hypothetical protein
MLHWQHPAARENKNARPCSSHQNLFTNGKSSNLFASHFASLVLEGTAKKDVKDFIKVKVNILWHGDPQDFWHQKLQTMCKGMICYHQAHLQDSQPGYQQVQCGAWRLPP